jgi:hypothetical protein
MNRLFTIRHRFGRSAVIAICAIVPLSGAIVASTRSQAATSTTFTVSGPSQVGVGQSFTVSISGVAAGRNVAVTVGTSTLGWATANATGVASVTSSWWSAGTITVEARIEGTGPVATTQILVGIDPPTTTTIAATTTTAPTGQITVRGAYASYLDTNQPVPVLRTLYNTYVIAASAADRTPAELTINCGAGTLITWQPPNQPAQRACQGPFGDNTVTVADSRGVYPPATLTWVSSPGPQTTTTTTTTTIPPTTTTAPPAGVISLSGAYGTQYVKTGPIPGLKTFYDSYVLTVSAPGRAAPSPTSTDLIINCGAGQLINWTPTLPTYTPACKGPYGNNTVTVTDGRGVYAPVTLTWFSSFDGQPTTTTTAPTTTVAPPSGRITVAARYIAGNLITGAPLAFSNPSFQYLVNPSPPNRTIDDFDVACSTNIGKSTNPNYPGYSCLTTADSLNTIVVSDKRGQYAPVTLLWWSTSPAPTVLESGSRYTVDIAAKYGISASEVTSASIDGGTCVAAICTVTTPLYWSPSTLPANRRPPDFVARYRFTARGASAEAAVAATIVPKPLVAPTTAVQGDPITLSWSGVPAGTNVSFRSGTSTLGWVVANGSGIATLRTTLWTTGPTEVTARNGDSFFFVTATVNVLPRGSVTTTTVVAPTTTTPTVTTTTPPNPSSVVVAVPANVAYGASFTIRISGLQPSNYAEVKIGDATLGWAQADSTGNASVTTSWWSRGSFTVNVAEIINGTRATPVTSTFSVS